MKPFRIYSGAADEHTLGYWRFGENGGRLVGVVNAKVLTNHGAEALQDGYRFVRADGDYMDANFTGQPERSQVTLECWVRDFGLALGQTGQIVSYGINANDYLSLIVQQNANPLLSCIVGSLTIGGAANIGYVRWYWTAEEIDAILTGSAPWHVALVLDATASLRLFVNGILRATDTTGILPLPLGNHLLRLGRYIADWPGYDLSAVLDEVRLSSVARYDANFPITRFQDGSRAVIRGPRTHAGLCAGVIQ